MHKIQFTLTELTLSLFHLPFPTTHPPPNSLHQSLFQKIKSGAFHLKSNSWRDVSLQAVDLVRKLLVLGQTERYTVDEALQHEWFQMPAGECSLVVLRDDMYNHVE